VGLLARAVVGPSERLLSMIGEWRGCFATYSGAFLENALLCVLLIPYWHSAGAGVAFSTALVIESVLLWLLTKRRLGMRFGLIGRIAGGAGKTDGDPPNA